MLARWARSRRTAVGAGMVALVGGLSVLTPVSGTPAANGEVADTAPTLSELAGVVAISPDDVWAVGLQEVASKFSGLAAHFDGTSWSAVPVPAGPADALSSSLTAVSASGPDDVWAVGSYYEGGMEHPLVDHWDGTTWLDVSPPTPAKGGEFQAVSTLGPADVWAVGTRDDWGQYLEHWDGNNWRLFNGDPGSFAWDELNGVAAYSKNNVWAVGEGYINPESSHPRRHSLAEQWTGSWKQANPKPDHPKVSHYLYAVTAIASHNIWAVGQGCCGILIEHHQTNWRQFTHPVPNMSGRLTGVDGTTRKDVWAVGWVYPRFTSFVMHWDGTSWTRFDDATPDAMTLAAVSTLSPTDAWAVGIRAADHQAIAEHWDGASWTPMGVF